MGITSRAAHLRRLRRHPQRARAQGRDSGRQLDAAARRQRARRPDRVRRADDRRAHQGRRGQARACRSTWAAGASCKTMAGSGGVVVFDDTTDVVALCARIMEFYAHESCGQCTPCREGSGWLARVCRRLAQRRGRAGRRRAAGERRQRHRRQHHLRARRRGGLADAGVPHQVPRRLRGQAGAVGEGAPGAAAPSTAAAWR